MASYVLRIVNIEQRVRLIPLTRLFAVPAERGSRYTILDADTKQPIDGVSLTKRGDNVIIEVNNQPVVHINRYYTDGRDSQVTNDTSNPISNSPPQVASTASEPSHHEPTSSPPHTSSTSNKNIFSGMGGGMNNILLGGAAVGGGLLLLAAGGKKDDNKDNGGGTTPTPAAGIVSGTVVAGPVIANNDLKVEVFQKDGTTKLGESSVAAGGKFSVAVGTYSGIVVVKVSSSKSGVNDYQDEATAKDKDLDTTLYSVGVIEKASGQISLNVNPLTTLAYQKMGASPNETTINNVHTAIAKAFGVDNLQSTEVVTVNGNSSFNPNDQLNAGETYGAILAALSGADTTTGKTQTTLDNLAKDITIDGNTATIGATARALLNSGGQVYNNSSAAKPHVLFTSGSSASVDENSATTTVVYKAAAYGKGNISYTLAGTDTDAFTIDGTTGELKFKASPNYESKTSYSVSITAKDANQSSQSKTVAIQINNKDEAAPNITSAKTATGISDSTTTGTKVYTATASDSASDGGPSTPISYSLKANTGNADFFSIDANTGDVSLSKALTSPFPEQLDFTMIATDHAGNASEQAVTVGVQVNDKTAPTVAEIAITNSSDTTHTIYNTGDKLGITVTMSEPVVTTGTPQLTLQMGTTPVTANYVSSNGNKMLFEYTIAAGNNDSNGISITANSLALNSGTIKDQAGNAATLTHTAVVDNPSYPVDTTVPTATLSNPLPIMLEASWNPRGLDQTAQITAVGNTGQFVVVWRGEDISTGNPGINNSIFVQKFNPDGSTLGNTLQINSLAPVQGDLAPAVANLSDDGQFAIVWSDYDATGQGHNIVVQKFKADGSVSGTPQKISAIRNPYGLDNAPQIAKIGSNGEFAVTWNAIDTANGDTSIYIQRFDKDGAPTGSKIVREGGSNTQGDDFTPQILALKNGEFAVAWSGMDITTTGSTSSTDLSIFVQKFDSSGTPTTQTMLEPKDITASSDFTPSMTAVGSNGEFVVAWSGQYVNGDRDKFNIYVQKLNADGSTTGQTLVELQAAGQNNGMDSAPQVAAIGSSGEYVVAWRGVNGNKGTSIYVQKFNANGTALETVPTQLDAASTNGVNQAPIVKSVSSTGDFVVAWQGRDMDGDDSIFVQKFSSTREKIGNTIQLEAKDYTTGNDSAPQITQLNSAGEFAITWQGIDRQGDSSIFVQKFNADGTLSKLVNTDQVALPDTNILAKSNEVGTAYLVHNSIGVQNESDILAANSKKWNSALLNSENNLSNTMTGNGLIGGDYTIYTVDSAGNISTSTSNHATISSIKKIAFTSKSDTTNTMLNTGDTAIVTATFYENMTVTGTPKLKLKVGDATATANYDSGSGTSELKFKYTVEAGQSAINGVLIEADGITTDNTSSIKDSQGNAAALSYDFVGGNTNYGVDAVAPVFVSGSKATVNHAAGASQTVYSALAGDSGVVSYSLKDGGDKASFSISSLTGAVTLIDNPSFSTKPSYNFTVVGTDKAGNSAEKAVTLYVENPNIVVFDLISGTSSDHSSRTFKADVDYTIYIRVDGAASTLNNSGNGPAIADSWAQWKGANNLTTTDKIVLVGKNADVLGKGGGKVNGYSNTANHHAAWKTSKGQLAATLKSDGVLQRLYNAEQKTLQLWTNKWATPNLNKTLNLVYLTKMPNNVLTTQGLA